MSTIANVVYSKHALVEKNIKMLNIGSDIVGEGYYSKSGRNVNTNHRDVTDCSR